MNFRFVVRQLGQLLIVLSVAILAVAALAAIEWTRSTVPEVAEPEWAGVEGLVISAGVGLAIGLGMIFATRKFDDLLGRREAMILVAMSWLIGAALAGLPYWVWVMCDDYAVADHPFRSFVNCYFESMSGLTTTGATVLTDIEKVPRGILLWRATTHWLGGLGIVVLFVAVLPSLGVGGKRLFQVEAPGPTQPGVRPRIRETARVLWLIYVGLTIVQTVLLLLCGMDFIDAVSHTFATLATGGFSTRNASTGATEFTLAMELIIVVFMVLAGANFGLYYFAIRGKIKNVLSDPEFKLYLAIIAAATILVAWGIHGERIVTTAGQEVDGTFSQSLRYALFQVVSIQTTTGFATADFNLWPFFPKAILLLLMFVGGCAGSTGGGIKVIRILITFKVLWAEIERVFRPNVVRPLKVGSATVDPEQRLAVLSYFIGIVLLFVIGAGLIMAFEPSGSCSVATATTACAATLNNVGPGFDRVGAIENYGFFTDGSKIVMSILMALGRLEVFAIMVLFHPAYWRAE